MMINTSFTSLRNRPPGSFWKYMMILLALAILPFTGCNNQQEKAPDVSGVKVDLQTYRFDIDLFAIDPSHTGDGLRKMAVKYPDFLNYYLDTLMAYGIHGNYNDTSLGIRELDTFLTYRDFVNLEDTVKKYYPDSKETDAALLAGFKNVKYYIPSYHVPKIIYLNMGLSKWSSFPLDSNTFCIGLDMFLGSQFPYYRSIGVPEYMDAHMRRSYMPVSVFSKIYYTLHPMQEEDKSLLDLMIQKGKEQYFLHKVLPNTADSILFGFTQVQLNWCNGNEAFVYNFFVHQNLLYDKQSHDIFAYVNDGPFAKNMEPVTNPVKYTPGNIGSWLGYRIVCAYMEQHPKTTLKELLDKPLDAARFLDEARYKPR